MEVVTSVCNIIFNLSVIVITSNKRYAQENTSHKTNTKKRKNTHSLNNHLSIAHRIMYTIYEHNNNSLHIKTINVYIYRLSLADKIVNFFWIPSHVGIAGNERADYLAFSTKSLIYFLLLKHMLQTFFRFTVNYCEMPGKLNGTLYT
ncbi:RNase H domain-containing protein [Aphis craccivora]|uniref:RNase H domain-containing protein n=1 Tax=Aphis craccivora TaxID=307492 RepID=A0A6G0ZNT7_APHCR|nr:RNase H domain-containing protein [Aphis craccivora]